MEIILEVEKNNKQQLCGAYNKFKTEKRIRELQIEVIKKINKKFKNILFLRVHETGSQT